MEISPSRPYAALKCIFYSFIPIECYLLTTIECRRTFSLSVKQQLSHYIQNGSKHDCSFAVSFLRFAVVIKLSGF